MLIDSQATGIAAAPSLSLLSLSLIAPHCNYCGRESGAGSAALSAKASDQTNQTPKAAPAVSRINKWSWSGRRRRRAVVANDDTRDAACVQFAKGWWRAGCAAGGERREGEHIWKSLTTSTAEAATPLSPMAVTVRSQSSCDGDAVVVVVSLHAAIGIGPGVWVAVRGTRLALRDSPFSILDSRSLLRFCCWRRDA